MNVETREKTHNPKITPITNSANKSDMLAYNHWNTLIIRQKLTGYNIKNQIKYQVAQAHQVKDVFRRFHFAENVGFRRHRKEDREKEQWP